MKKRRAGDIRETKTLARLVVATQSRPAERIDEWNGRLGAPRGPETRVVTHGSRWMGRWDRRTRPGETKKAAMRQSNEAYRLDRAHAAGSRRTASKSQKLALTRRARPRRRDPRKISNKQNATSPMHNRRHGYARGANSVPRANRLKTFLRGPTGERESNHAISSGRPLWHWIAPPR